MVKTKKKININFNFKDFIEKNQVILYLIVLLFICWLASLSAGQYVEFKPINGTFQNFNPVRRLLSGQIPYKDFVDYLGFGHLFFGTISTFIFGGNYQGSLIAFTFLSILSTVMLSYVISFSIFKDKKNSILITSALIMILLINPLFFQYILSIDSQFLNALSIFASPGNSARFIRGMILPIFVMLFTLIYKKIENTKFSLKRKNILFLFCISSISALSFIWSNDYGISTWVCSIILYFFILLKNTKKLSKTILFTILEIFTSFIFVYLYVTILTFGNFSSWLSATFGTGGYQSWYYNSSKSYYIFNIDISFWQSFQILLSLYYFYSYLKNKNNENNLKYLILGFVNMTAFCAINEYKLLSGGKNYEYGTTILFFTIIYEIINFTKEHFVKNRINFTKCLLVILAITQISWIINRVHYEFVFRVSDKSGVYIDELGGYNYTFGKELISTKEFLQDKKVFSTYSSAIETITNQYNPTKYDYIIHVLGDNVRKEYLEEFKNGNFDYAATIQRYYTHWELGWISRANWFFYRELYNDYHPVYGNTYELFWEKNTDETNYITNNDYNIEVNYRRVDDSTIILSINTDESVNGYADLYLDYKVKKNDRFITNLMFNKMLMITNNDNIEKVNNNDFDYNYLKDESKEYVPIKIINGKGSIVLTSKPDESTRLIVNNASCDKIFTVLYNYVEVDSVIEDDGKVKLKIDKNMTTSAAVKDAKKIVINDEKILISKVIQDGSIFLVLKTNMTKYDIQNIMKTNNNFMIIK